MKVKKELIASLSYDPANAMGHPDENIEAIKGSLKRFGQQKPIVVDAKGVVRAGNGTLRAAIALGWTDIVVTRSDLTGSELTAYALADNRTSQLGQWDMGVLGATLKALQDEGFPLPEIGFGDDFLKVLEPELPPGLTDPDDVPASAETRCKAGDLWVLGRHRLLCGDSTQLDLVERLMGGEMADLLFTDPPYGVSYGDKNAFLNAISRGNSIQIPIKNDHMKPDEMNEFWADILTNVYAVTSNKASYYICSPQGGDLMMMMMMSIIRAGWQLKHMLIWVKNNHVLGRCDYNYKHEPILYGWKTEGTHEFIGEGRCKTSVWDFPKPKKNDLHPTMKPVDLYAEAILNSSRRDGLVIDPFLGSGSTLIACEKTGRRCYGLELDEHYCDIIIKRWEDFTGKTAVLGSE